MQALCEKYRPRTIAGFAGLKMAKALMGKLAASPWESSWLFVGDSGTGKTALAFAVAEALDAEVIHIPSSKCNKDTVDGIIEHCGCMPMFHSWYVVLVDEAADMTTAAQNSFLSILDGSGHFPKHTVFIFTCNSAEKLEKRFQSRCRVIQFDGGVDASDLGTYLYDVWFAEAPSHATAPLMHKLIADCQCNVRAALMALEMELLLVPERRAA
jgi:putative ATPase